MFIYILSFVIMFSQLEKEVDEFRKRLQSLKTEKQNQLLVSTSIVQEHQDELERIQLSVKSQEEDKLMVEDKKKDISRELSQVTQALRNLYGRCFNTMRIKPVFFGQQKESATNVSEILDYELDIILLRIKDLVEISEEYKQSLDTNYGGGNSSYSGNNNGATLSTMSITTTGDLKENSIVSSSQQNTNNNNVSKVL